MKTLFVLVAVALVGCGETAHDRAVVAQAQQSPALPPVKHLLASGNGNDWEQLSDREKLRLCMVIEETIGEKEAWDYREFLGTFYQDEENRTRSIAEVAAVAAALESD